MRIRQHGVGYVREFPNDNDMIMPCGLGESADDMMSKILTVCEYAERGRGESESSVGK